LESVALNLHGFYSGVERLFELIARRVDQNLPSGDMWHRDLLHQMTQDIRELRPAVISSERVSSLDELRRFSTLSPGFLSQKTRSSLAEKPKT